MVAAGTRAQGDRLRQARRALLDGEEPVGVREEILASWRRSADRGVDPVVLRAPDESASLDLESPVARAGEPVMAQLTADIAETTSSVALVDHRGRVLHRGAGTEGGMRALDQVLIAPGFSYAERHVGTNAMGTALETRSPVVVHREEHFNERLTGMACWATPVRDPVTRRIVGALGMASAGGAADAAHPALVRQAGQLIENRLLDLHADGHRELLAAYLASVRQGPGRSFALGADVLHAAPEVMRLLGGLAHDDLWPVVAEVLARRDQAEVPLPQPDGETVEVRLTACKHRGRLAGAIGEVLTTPGDRFPAQPRPAAPLAVPELAGWSTAARAAAVTVRRLAEESLAVCVTGEAGVGKATTVRHVANRVFPGRNLVTVEPAELRVGDVVSALETGAPVLVPRVDRMASGDLTRLLQATEDAPGRGWLSLTWQGPVEGLPDLLQPPSVRVVPLGPLRSRPEDVVNVLPRLLDRHARGRRVALTPALVERLRREPWPTNITGLNAVVAELVRNAPGPVIDVPDLDAAFQATVRRRLTPVEWLMRSAIVEALKTHGGNKDLAAEALGLSRASIYRKIKSLDIGPVDVAGE